MNESAGLPEEVPMFWYRRRPIAHFDRLSCRVRPTVAGSLRRPDRSGSLLALPASTTPHVVPLRTTSAEIMRPIVPRSSFLPDVGARPPVRCGLSWQPSPLGVVVGQVVRERARSAHGRCHPTISQSRVTIVSGTPSHCESSGGRAGSNGVTSQTTRRTHVREIRTM